MTLSFDTLDRIVEKKLEKNDLSDITLYGDARDIFIWQKWLNSLGGIAYNISNIMSPEPFKFTINYMGYKFFIVEI